MTEDAASLKNLHDIVLPAPVPNWPPDTGGLLILAGLVLVLLVLGLQLYLGYRKNRYRRAGLALLGRAATVQDVSIALKRVALAAFAREQVASLYGAEWVDFLNGSCADTEFADSSFNNPALSPEPALLQSAKKWISSHRVDATEPEPH